MRQTHPLQGQLYTGEKADGPPYTGSGRTVTTVNFFTTIELVRVRLLGHDTGWDSPKNKQVPNLFNMPSVEDLSNNRM